jgi:predicted TPR repeat methyltransferase
MDADDIAEVIQNMRGPYEDAYKRCVAVLKAHNALPQDSETIDDVLRDQGTYDVAKALGEAVRDMIDARALREYRLDIGAETTFTATLMSKALGTVSWTDVGDRYYALTRERYWYDHHQR